MSQLKLSAAALLDLQEYPAVRVGGVYALLLGLVVMLAARFEAGTLALSVLLGGTFLVSIGTLFNRPLRKYLAFARLPASQKRITKIVFVSECLGASALLVLFSSTDPNTLIALLLVVLALAQLALAYVYGPWMLLLGALGTVNALAALWLHNIPLTVVTALDGILKLGFGFLMLISSW